MTTASGISRARSARWSRPGGALRAAVTWPAQAPSMCPPTTAASWIVHTRLGGSQSPFASWNAHPNRSQPRWNGSVERDDDVLAVDQQVRQVVRDEVADRDRQQAGAGRRARRRPASPRGRRARSRPGRSPSRTVVPPTPGVPNPSKKAWVWYSPSNRIEPMPEADERDVGDRSSPARGGRWRTAGGGSGPPRRPARTRPAGRGVGTRR